MAVINLIMTHETLLFENCDCERYIKYVWQQEIKGENKVIKPTITES